MCLRTSQPFREKKWATDTCHDVPFPTTCYGSNSPEVKFSNRQNCDIQWGIGRGEEQSSQEWWDVGNRSGVMDSWACTLSGRGRLKPSICSFSNVNFRCKICLSGEKRSEKKEFNILSGLVFLYTSGWWMKGGKEPWVGGRATDPTLTSRASLSFSMSWGRKLAIRYSTRQMRDKISISQSICDNIDASPKFNCIGSKLDYMAFLVLGHVQIKFSREATWQVDGLK